MEGLGEGLLADPAELLQPGFQGLIKQQVTFRMVISLDLSVLRQLEIGQRPFHHDKPILQGLGPLDGLLMGRTSDLPPGHPGDENGLDAVHFLRVAVQRQMELGEDLRRILTRAGLQLLAELGPGIGELPDHLAGLRVHRQAARLALNIAPLPKNSVSPHLLDHSIRSAGNDQGIHRVVEVAIRPHLGNAPALAHVSSHGTVDRSDLLLVLGRGRKGKVVLQIILQEHGHGLRVLKVALPEPGPLLLGDGLFQQEATLPMVLHMGVDPHHKVVLPLAAQVFHGQAVALVSVFLGQDQHLVFVAVVIADAVGHDVVHFRIVLLKKAFRGNGLAGVSAPPILLLPKFELDQVEPSGVVFSELRANPLHPALVLRPVF